MVNLKRILIVLTVILLINPISFAQIIWAEGLLADESFIEIENSDDLTNIKDDLTENYILTDDIYLNEAEWEPIVGEFTGTLTGEDFVIQNMSSEYLEDENLGLFTEVEDLDNIDVEIEFAAKEIENSDELANIKNNLTGDYILTQDIDLQDAEWEPIDEGEFTGTLTGDDFIIQNMPTQYSEDENYGLFTEVENLDNLDVDIEFMEEEIEEPEEENAIEKDSEEIEKQEANLELNNETVEKNFIEIENSDDLANIKEDLTEDYVITKDIDLKDAEWEAIDEDEFTGTLTGDDFVIQNMPAQYSKDENIGLFTEVKDIENIDVEVRFAEAEIEEPQVEEEAVEKEADEPEIEQEVTKRAMIPMAEGQPSGVTNWFQLRKALEDPSVTEINFEGPILRDAGLIIYVAPRKGTEPIVINGNNHLLSVGGSNTKIRMEGNQNGIATDIIFKNISLKPTSENALLSQRISTRPVGKDFTVTFDNIISNGDAAHTKGGLVNAKNANVVFKGKADYVTNGTPTIINEAKSVLIDKESDVIKMHTKGNFYKSSQEGAKLTVNGKLNILASNDSQESLIHLSGNNSEIIVDGPSNKDDPNFEISSQRRLSISDGNYAKVGLIKLTGEKAEFNVMNGAKVKFVQTSGTVLFMDSVGGQVNIEGPGTEVNFSLLGDEIGEEYKDNAVIHLHHAEAKAKDYKIKIDDNAKLDVEKKSGTAPAIRVGTGINHQINVTDKSEFIVHNGGSDGVKDPNGIYGANQAILYNSIFASYEERPRFNLDSGSTVKLTADNGAALHMSGGGDIIVGKDTTFIAEGKTASDNRGIIDTGHTFGTLNRGEGDTGSNISINSPKFYDLNNKKGGLVFHTGGGAGIKSEFKGDNIDIELWNKGNSLNEKSDISQLNVREYDYNLGDFSNKKQIIPSNDEIIGLNNYSRIRGTKPESGKLEITSAPVLNFTDKKINTNKAVEYLVDPIPKDGDHLKITDSRYNKANWQLEARMSKQFEDELTKAPTDELTLIYYENGVDKEINHMSNTVVKKHVYDEDNPNPAGGIEFNLSKDWTEGPVENGIFIRVERGIKKADYVGEVTWTLQIAP